MKKGFIPFAALLYITALLFFLWGVAAGNYKIFPWKQMAAIYEEIHSYLSGEQGQQKELSDKLVLDHQEYRSKYTISGFHKRDPDFFDDGFLLIARYSKKHGQAIVELFSIADEKILHTWIPKREDLKQHTTRDKFPEGDPLTPQRYRVTHPLLLEDGSLVFNTAPPGPMARTDVCGKILWVNNHQFHHSNELDHNKNIVSPTIIENDGQSKVPLRNDGFAIVTLDGEIVKEYSVSDILLQGGYRGLLYGIGNFERDRIHLNDAQPVNYNSDDAAIGDILLSIRHLSTVMLFSPIENKIKWLKTGPWLNQHDINQYGPDGYSIFGNDVFRKNDLTGTLINGRNSEMYIFNPTTGSIKTPFSEILAKNPVATETEGRSRMLENGDVFIEESNYSRLLRLSENKVRWEYVNGLSTKTVGTLNWSRYLTKNELNLNWLENKPCNTSL